MTRTTGPVAQPRADDEPTRSDQAILPPRKVLPAWDSDPMSAARSAAKKKPRSGPVAVPDLDPTPEPEPVVEPDPEPAAPEPPAPEAGVRPNAWAAPMNALGGFIRAQRQLAKLSLRDMATMTSVSNAYLSQVERGLHQPSLKVLHSIADALQLSTEQLLSQAGWATHSADQAGATASRHRGGHPHRSAADAGAAHGPVGGLPEFCRRNCLT